METHITTLVCSLPISTNSLTRIYKKKYIYIYLLLLFWIVSENKVLCHPASIDSLTTSAGTEDHVSMGGFAARKALIVVEHVEQGTNRIQV